MGIGGKRAKAVKPRSYCEYVKKCWPMHLTNKSFLFLKKNQKKTAQIVLHGQEKQTNCFYELSKKNLLKTDMVIRRQHQTLHHAQLIKSIIILIKKYQSLNLHRKHKRMNASNRQKTSPLKL